MIDIWTPVRTGDFEADLRAESRRRLELNRQCRADPVTMAAAIERCKRAPRWFVDSFIWGFDDRRKAMKLHPVVTFDHQAELLQAVLGRSPLLLDASRAVGKTVIVLAGIIHDALFNPPASFGMTSRSGAEVDHGGMWQSLFGMLRLMLDRLPPWMFGKPPRRFRGQRYRYKGSPPYLIELPNGSQFVGQKAGPKAFHGPRYRRIIVDEAARIDRLRDMMTGVMGATDAPVLISTPRGRAGYFPALIHGELSPVEQWRPGVEVTPGAWGHVRIHYSRDPRYDEKWKAKKFAEVGDKVIWAQQYEIDYTSSVSGRIWQDFNRQMHLMDQVTYDDRRRQRWWPGSTIIEAWDPGLNTAVVWLSEFKDEHGPFVYVLDYRYWREVPLLDILAEIQDEQRGGLAYHYHRCATVRVADPAMAQRNALNLKSWRSEMRRAGIALRTPSTMAPRDMRETVRRQLRQQGITFCPPCDQRHPDRRDLPSLVEAVENYRLDTRGINDLRDFRERGGEPDALKDEFSHLADALQYACDWVWPAQKGGIMARQDDGTWGPAKGAGVGIDAINRKSRRR